MDARIAHFFGPPAARARALFTHLNTPPPATAARIRHYRLTIAVLGLIAVTVSAIASVLAGLPGSPLRIFVYLTLTFFFAIHVVPIPPGTPAAEIISESDRTRSELFFAGLTLGLGLLGALAPLSPDLRCYRSLLGLAFAALLALPYRIPIRSGRATVLIRVLVPISSLLLTFFVDAPLLAAISEAPLTAYLARVDAHDIVPPPGDLIARALNLGVPAADGFELSPRVHDALHAVDDDPIAATEHVASHILPMLVHTEDRCPALLIVEADAPRLGYMSEDITEPMASCALAAHSPRAAGAVYRFLLSAPPSSYSAREARACNVRSPAIWAILTNAASVSGNSHDPNAIVLANTLLAAARSANGAPIDVGPIPSLTMLVPCFRRARSMNAHPATTSRPSEIR